MKKLRYVLINELTLKSYCYYYIYSGFTVNSIYRILAFRFFKSKLIPSKLILFWEEEYYKKSFLL